MILDIYKKPYHILSHEFNKITHHEFNYLILYDKLGFYERIHGLLRELSESLNIRKLVWNTPTHGGYSLVQCSPFFETIFVSNIDESHLSTIEKNLIQYEIKNILWLDLSGSIETDFLYITENLDTIDMDFIKRKKPLFLCPMKIEIIQNPIIRFLFPLQLQLSDSNMVLFIPIKWEEKFKTEFSYYLDPLHPNSLAYDNLIELCIMVRNAGEQFEDTLKANLPLVDRWTLLDTGSTDNTIDIAKRVLSGKKGKVYQEPFLNFRDSRNRCLELAGTCCKYTLMLDDTYRIQGNLRHFLNTVRSDQYADSFSLYIQSHDVQYATNRILISERKLKYKYKLHEVIQPENNNNVIIPYSVSGIFDYRCDYMEERTMARKQYDLKILFEEIEEYPEDPRCYYYIAQTYNVMGEHELSYEYFLKRGFHPVEGFIQEKIDALFEAGRIANFKLNRPWEECFELYTKAYELDTSRPDSLYFIGIHYYTEKNMRLAFDYLKKAFQIGYPLHCQYSLKPTLSFHFLPKFLAELCFSFEEYSLGLEVVQLFLSNNQSTDDSYSIMVSWRNIFELLIPESSENKIAKSEERITFEIQEHIDEKPYLIYCIVFKNEQHNWVGNTEKESSIVSMAKDILQMESKESFEKNRVALFCSCNEEKIEDGIFYFSLKNYGKFIKENRVFKTILCNAPEYLPLSNSDWVEHCYLYFQESIVSGMIVPILPTLKHIYCSSQQEVESFIQAFPVFSTITSVYSNEWALCDS